jgi:hypothetical protein
LKNTPAFEGVGVQVVFGVGSAGVTWYPAFFSSLTIFTKRARWRLALTAGPRSDL